MSLDVLDLSPLDLLLFRGNDFVSNTISKLEDWRVGDGRFTHVGILINNTLWPHPTLRDNEWYVWESTMSKSMCGLTDGVPDVVSGKGVFGVQVRNLRDLLEKYDGSVYWAPLRDRVFEDEEMRSFFIERFRVFQQKYGNATYDASFVELLGAMIPALRCFRNSARLCRTCGGLRKENEWLFCSEGVAMIYQQLGILSSKFEARDVVPADFLGKDEDGIPKLFGNPVRLS